MSEWCVAELKTSCSPLPKVQHCMDGCGRNVFRELLIGLVVLLFSGTMVLAGSPGDLKPRVPLEHLAVMAQTCGCI